MSVIELSEAQSIGLYIATLLWYYAWSAIYNYYKNITIFYISLLLPFLVASTKDIMSPDLYRYAITYETIENILYPGIEVMYSAVTLILKEFGFTYHATFFVYSLLTFSFFTWGLRIASYNIALSMLIYLQVPGLYLNQFVLARQSLAVSISFLFTIMLFKGKKLSAYLLMVLAVLSHFSSVFYITILLLLKKGGLIYKKLDTLVLMCLFILSVITGYFGGDVLFHYVYIILTKIHEVYPSFLTMFLNKYAELTILRPEYSPTHLLIKLIFYNFFTFLICFLVSKDKNLKQEDIAYTNLLFLGAILLNISFYIPDVTRLANYFLVFQLLAVPITIRSIKNREYRLIFFVTMCIMYFAQFIKGIFFYSIEVEDYIFLKYKSFFLDWLLKG